MPCKRILATYGGQDKMKREHIKYLFCPKCEVPLRLFKEQKSRNNVIEKGILQCSMCKSNYDIIRHIPRFVPLENYANSFGLQWTTHGRTQYDSYTNTNISEKRFFGVTRWDRNLSGQIMLEVGSGSGRFTEQALSTNAMVISMDYSCAVEANYLSNGKMENVLIVQADLYSMPFQKNSFDKLFCFGVLQHTPDPRRAFMGLPAYLKKGGTLVVDIYYKNMLLKQLLNTKYWIRPFTKKMNPESLYSVVRKYVNFMYPIAKCINRVPYGRGLNRRLFFIADYRGHFDLKEDLLREWAILDTFDMLSPRYDKPQDIDTVKQWFKDSNLKNIDVYWTGGTNIHGRADAL